jgi:hypothetical protein
MTTKTKKPHSLLDLRTAQLLKAAFAALDRGEDLPNDPRDLLSPAANGGRQGGGPNHRPR